MICGESNGVRDESTACGPAERKKDAARDLVVRVLDRVVRCELLRI